MTYFVIPTNCSSIALPTGTYPFTPETNISMISSLGFLSLYQLYLYVLIVLDQVPHKIKKLYQQITYTYNLLNIENCVLKHYLAILHS
jgi:hypothetical protein